MPLHFLGPHRPAWEAPSGTVTRLSSTRRNLVLRQNYIYREATACDFLVTGGVPSFVTLLSSRAFREGEETGTTRGLIGMDASWQGAAGRRLATRPLALVARTVSAVVGPS